MKKLLIMSLILLTAGVAFAGFSGPSTYQAQGYQGSLVSATSISSVKDVLGMFDDQITTVRGNITKRISDDKYIFKDATGEMVVEIDEKYWMGLQVDEKDTLELTGKVDKDYNSVSLDVFVVKKVK